LAMYALRSCCLFWRWFTKSLLWREYDGSCTSLYYTTCKKRKQGGCTLSYMEGSLPL
jgi:hypothetical protein